MCQSEALQVQAECNETPVYVLSGAGSKQVTRHLRMKVTGPLFGGLSKQDGCVPLHRALHYSRRYCRPLSVSRPTY